MMRFRRTQGKNPVCVWLLSYADMATILLALFIVVSVLSRDQTGCSFYLGSGAYLQAAHRLGTGEQGSAPAPEKPAVPRYLGPLEKQGGKGEDGEPGRSWWEREGEEARLEQLLFELGRQHAVMRLPRQASQLIIDLYGPLNRKAPVLGAQHQEALERLLAMLERPDYRVQVVVWATTPAPSAWARAAEQAQEVCAEFISSRQLDAEVASRLTGLGQPWAYRDIRRPVLSLVLLRTE